MIDDQDGLDVSPVELTPIDPLLDESRFEALTRAIVRDGMAARVATRAGRRPRSAMTDVARWSLPILAAAALVVAAAIPTLALSGRRLASAEVDPNPPADRLGLPASIFALTRPGSDPTPADVVAAFDSRWSEGAR